MQVSSKHTNTCVSPQRQRGPSSHLTSLAMQVEEAVRAANLHSLSECCTGVGSTDNIFLPVPPPERDAGCCLGTYLTLILGVKEEKLRIKKEISVNRIFEKTKQNTFTLCLRWKGK